MLIVLIWNVVFIVVMLIVVICHIELLMKDLGIKYCYLHCVCQCPFDLQLQAANCHYPHHNTVNAIDYLLPRHGHTPHPLAINHSYTVNHDAHHHYHPLHTDDATSANVTDNLNHHLHHNGGYYFHHHTHNVNHSGNAVTIITATANIM